MKITTELLTAHEACSEGVALFLEHFPSGEAEYQDVLNKLAELNESDYALWLFEKFGNTSDVLEINGDLRANNVFFAGYIRVSGRIIVMGDLICCGVSAHGSVDIVGFLHTRELIKVGGNLTTGDYIDTEGGIIVQGDVTVGVYIDAKHSIDVGGTIESDGCLKSGHNISAGGSAKAAYNIETLANITVGGDILSGTRILIGNNMTAGGNIIADMYIKVGGGISAGGLIKSGEDFGVFAGLHCRLSAWSTHARVIAQEKPRNLISGYWVKPTSKEK